jgi:hypothetical protein
LVFKIPNSLKVNSNGALRSVISFMGWDLSPDVLARIESGIMGITDKEIAIFSDVLGVTVQELPPLVSLRGM